MNQEDHHQLLKINKTIVKAGKEHSNKAKENLEVKIPRNMTEALLFDNKN